MQEGRLALDWGDTHVFWGLLLGVCGYPAFGIGPTPCSFRSDDEQQEEVVIAPGNSRPAFRCESCSTVVITDPPKEKFDWPNMRNYGAGRS